MLLESKVDFLHFEVVFLVELRLLQAFVNKTAYVS
jgi:hypothetical protein